MGLFFSVFVFTTRAAEAFLAVTEEIFFFAEEQNGANSVVFHKSEASSRGFYLLN